LFFTIINNFTELENKLINEGFNSKWFISYNWKIPILITAPHSVKQFRNNSFKIWEYRTWSIANYLYEKTKCFCVYKTRCLNDDANYDAKNYFKEVVIEIVKEHKIKFLIDLHIMSPKHKHMIDIWTWNWNNIFWKFKQLNDLVQIFNKHNINDVEIDKVFDASNVNTVSSTVSKLCNIWTLQIEINWQLLDENNKNNKLTDLLSSLIEIIKLISLQYE